ncbi:MAG: hypothetical protein IPJ65_18205 [Archangiaceae bacterium]|nr:hypothetical protein [Archangiaceae bacterium]
MATEKVAVSAGFEQHLGDRHTFVAGAGAVVAGSLEYPDRRHYELGTGATAWVGYGFLIVRPKGAVPFVSASATLSGAWAPTRLGDYVAVDLRAAATMGWVLYDRFSPYLAARAFGGPVFWASRVSGDAYHYQLGAGFVLGLTGGLDLTCEIVPFGEQSLSLGMGLSF